MSAGLDSARALDVAHVMGTYGSRKPVLFEYGSGMMLIDDAHREYLDFVSGLGVVNLGHCHPEVTEAIRAQSERLAHVSNLFYFEHQGRFAEAISAMAGGGRKVFFCNSGAEASEGAIKLARKWGKTHKGSACIGVVTALDSFHGRTLAALAATGQPSKHEPFEPMPAGFSHVPLNDLDALAEAIGPDTCAVMLETIQGEGGVNPCTTEYLVGAEALCREREVLLVIDEVQSGCWRTGPALAHMAYGVHADIVTMAKALANGLPVGAVVASEDVAVFGPGDHGSTFGGGPLVCAAGLATLAALGSEGLGDNAIEVGAYLSAGLGELAAKGIPIADVRGAGLMIGCQLDGVDAAAVVDHALASGIVLNNIGSDVVRFLPPLVCEKQHVDAALSVLEDAISAAQSGATPGA